MKSSDHNNDEMENDEVSPIEESIEAESVEVSSESEEPIVRDLQAELDAAIARADESDKNYLLAKAEVENIRRRTQKDVEKARRYSIEKFANELLPVIDSLEMGIAAAEKGAGDVDALKEGMSLTYKQLMSSFEKSGITELNPDGEAFNPELHQAMSIVPSPDHQPNTVMQVFQKGYSLNSRLLRPAMVIVSQAVPTDESKKIDEQA